MTTQDQASSMESFNDPQTRTIIGAAMEVHTQLGCGFLEAVYRCALSLEFHTRGMPFASEVRLAISYKGRELPVSYRVDFICFGDILVEVKALDQIGPLEIAQVVSYLKAANCKRALLLNFGARSLQLRRIVAGLPSSLDPLHTLPRMNRNATQHSEE